MADNEIKVYEPINREDVKARIFEIRGFRVMLDSDIANYFGVTTGNLNKAKNRNINRFPDNFSFVLTDQEVSLFQSGIAIQTQGVKGGRSNNPTVYTEQGVAMLTSVLHTERAICASIQIIEAFVEMSHYLKENRQLLTSEGLEAFELKHYRLADRVQNIEDNMITRDDLSALMKLFDAGIRSEETLILNGEPFKADLAYQKIYKKAKKNIITIDNYLGVKTLQHLVHAKENTDITIISDNKGFKPLRRSEYNDFQTEYPRIKIRFIRAQNKIHDRYIVLDYGTRDMKIYHCGTSSNSAGGKVTTITELKETNVYKEMIKGLLSHPVLKMK
jgi:hypothetical protein